MEKTSLALRLERIALEVGSQIDSKYQNKMARKATRIGLESHENGKAKPREWERKNHENGNTKGRESLRIGTKKCPAFNVSHAQQGYNYNSNLSYID